MVDKKDKVESTVEEKEEVAKPKTTSSRKSTKETESTTKETPKKPKRKLRQNEISRTTDVVIKNNTSGGLVYICPKNYTKYRLDNYGDQDEMPIDELIHLKNTKRKYLERYWLIIAEVSTDEYTLDEVLEALKLEDLYSGDYKVMLDIDGFILGNVSEIKKVYPKLNQYAQEMIIKRAKSLHKDGEIEKLGTYEYFRNVPEAEGIFE